MGDQQRDIFGKNCVLGHHYNWNRNNYADWCRVDYNPKWWQVDFRPVDGNGHFNKRDHSVILRAVRLFGGCYGKNDCGAYFGRDMVAIEWQGKYPEPVPWPIWADAFRHARPLDFRVGPRGWSCPQEHKCEIGGPDSCYPNGPHWDKAWRKLYNQWKWDDWELGYPEQLSAKKVPYFRLDARARSR